MRRILIAFSVVAAVALALAASDAPKSSASLPAGVSSDSWIPLGESLGFVVQTTVTHTNAPDAVVGYFMVRRAGEWHPVQQGTVPGEPTVRRIPFRRGN